ncbi:hypothetical protein ACLB2K_041262 [Fragaria x ananassa]
MDLFTSLFSPAVTDVMNLELVREFEEEEIEASTAVCHCSQPKCRQILDNSLLAFEISHHLKRLYGFSQGFGALKVDMGKAYDRVEWNFIESVMPSMGFHQKWVQWVMGCVRSVCYSFLINGEPRGHLIPSRGLRQGDSISPYLFLLCAEGLSRMLMYAQSRDFIYGVSIATGAPSINHLFFTDDSFIFMRAEAEECNRIKNILKVYEEANGQQNRVDKHDKYLGLPTEVSYSKVEAFRFVMEKARDKLKSWKYKTLSTAGKEIMIKSVVQSIPTYVMSVFELSKHNCHEMHRVMAGFWWGDSEKGRKIHWLAWERMCAPKEDGGLGFCNMELFNQALLAIQGWRILNQPNSLVYSTLKAKYFLSSSFLSASAKNSDSLFSGVMEGFEELKVIDLIDPDSSKWMVDLLEELFFDDEVDIIKKIPLSVRNPPDKLVWHFDKHGSYTAKSGYHVAKSTSVERTQGSSSNPEGSRKEWKQIWRVRVQPKIKRFVWSPLGLRARNHGANNMVEWLTEMMETLQTKLIWEGRIFDPMRNVHWALRLLEGHVY